MTAYFVQIKTNLNKAKLIHYFPDDNILDILWRYVNIEV